MRSITESGNEIILFEMDSRSPQVMEDLINRLLSILESERRDYLRLFSHIEEAYKCYELQLRVSPYLPQYTFKTFIEMLLHRSASLAEACAGANLDLLIERWKVEQMQPLIGAIIINPSFNKCILIQNASGNWEFPITQLQIGKGEIGTAIVHVHKMTGLDTSGSVREDHFLEGSVRGARVKAFIVVLRSEEIPLHKSVKWFTIKLLPHHGDVAIQTNGVDTKHLFNVIPFVQSLWEWIASHQTAFVHSIYKDTPDPRVKGQKQITPQPPITPLRGTSKVKASLTKSHPLLEVPIIANHVALAPENLSRGQTVPCIVTTSPRVPALLPTPLFPSPQHQHSAIAYLPGTAYQGSQGIRGLVQPPLTYYGTPLPAHRGPAHSYGHAHNPTPPVVASSHSSQPNLARAGGVVAVSSDPAHNQQVPHQLECAKSLVNFRFKGSVFT